MGTEALRHISKTEIDGTAGDRLILYLHPRLNDEQKELFAQRMKTQHAEYVFCVCWRTALIVRITLCKKNCPDARIDVVRLADKELQSVIAAH